MFYSHDVDIKRFAEILFEKNISSFQPIFIFTLAWIIMTIYEMNIDEGIRYRYDFVTLSCYNVQNNSI